MKKFIIGVSIIGLSILGSVLGYGYINQKTKFKIEESRIAEKKAEELRLSIEKENQEEKLQKCLIVAFEDYKASWEGSCKKRGREENCSLPEYQAKSYNEKLEIDEANCIKMFGK